MPQSGSLVFSCVLYSEGYQAAAYAAITGSVQEVAPGVTSQGRYEMLCHDTYQLYFVLWNTQAAKIISKTNTTQVNNAHLICVVVQR